MDPAYLLVPFIGGLAAKAVRLPPLVGFLAAGFALHVLGYDSIPALEAVADIGVTLLLFTIGLKLKVHTLLRKEVWVSATAHMLLSTGMMVAILSVLKLIGFALLADAGLATLALLGFALSFSSTVFAVKVLEERNESRSLYGRIAIGVLIMQDIFAVVFLTGSTGELPSPWALALLALIPAAPLLRFALARMGHGEMQILYGVVLALVLGYALFEQVGLKGDLGALIVGMLLAPHAATEDMSRALFNMKELFLVGFFVSIGLTGLPSVEMVVLALLLVVAVPLKSLLFLVLFSRFRLRHRTTLLATLSLSNYSEFGLIVAVLAAGNGWLDADWLVVLSLSVALSFGAAAVLNSVNEHLYTVVSPRLRTHEPDTLHPEDRPVEIGDAQAVVLGMGRVGRGAYSQLASAYGLRVLGVDNNAEKISALGNQGYRVAQGDAVDSDFWDSLVLCRGCEVVILAMPYRDGNLFALEQLRQREFPGRIAAVVAYAEDIEPLRRRGADAVYHLYDEAGTALAEHAAQIAGLRRRREDDES